MEDREHRFGRRLTRRRVALGAWIGILLAPAAGEALDLSVVAPSPHSDLHVGVVGDTLAGGVTFRVVDENGVGAPDVPIHLVASGSKASPPVIPSLSTPRTDATGTARVGLRLQGPAGDHLLIATIPGDEVSVAEVRVRILDRSWVRWLLLGVAGGLAIFLYGMRLAGRGLERSAGGRMRDFLGHLTSNRWSSLLFGIVSTAIVQSSSATTILLVGFVGAGLITLGQSLGAVLGTAIGTTVTVQLIAFKVSDWALLFVAAGFAMTFSQRRSRLGEILLGFGLLFFGLKIMSEAMAPLRGLPVVAEFFITAARNPLPAVLAATLFTALVQASAATIGIVLGLAFQGILTLDAAIPFILGANIGTTATALLASATSSPDGKRVAWSHFGFQAIGVALVFPFLPFFTRLVQSAGGDLARQIANAHTLFNLITAGVFLPLLPAVARGLHRLIPDREEPVDDFRPKSLDPRFHEQPSLALAGALREVLRMGQLVGEMLDGVKQAVRTDDKELAKSIRAQDDRVDLLDESITEFLTDLSRESLSSEQSQRVLDYLFITKDFELMADIVSKGLVPGLLRKKRKQGLWFSDEGFRELLDFHDHVREAVELAVSAVATWDRELAGRILEEKREISRMERRLHLKHLERLRAGNEESRATTTVHVDAVNDLKRIVTHTARVAYAVLGKIHDLPKDEEVVFGGPSDEDEERD
jgi:phosphate:Na+ symporter